MDLNKEKNIKEISESMALAMCRLDKYLASIRYDLCQIQLVRDEINHKARLIYSESSDLIIECEKENG
jgi:hypothetical protein